MGSGVGFEVLGGFHGWLRGLTLLDVVVSRIHANMGLQKRAPQFFNKVAFVVDPEITVELINVSHIRTDGFLLLLVFTIPADAIPARLRWVLFELFVLVAHIRPLFVLVWGNYNRNGYSRQQNGYLFFRGCPV